jgi:hypothetical protein
MGKMRIGRACAQILIRISVGRWGKLGKCLSVAVAVVAIMGSTGCPRSTISFLTPPREDCDNSPLKDDGCVPGVGAGYCAKDGYAVPNRCDVM